MHLQETTLFAQNFLHHVTYSGTKFEVFRRRYILQENTLFDICLIATSNGLGGDTFTRNARTDYGRTDTQTLLQMDYCWVLSVLEKVAKKT